MSKPINILITGSNYWNCGDDIVREGAMALFRAALHPREINWHFHNFIVPEASIGQCGEIPNTVSIRDLKMLAAHIDLVVIPGLGFGRELHTFQAKLLEVGLGPKTIFIGGMNENAYAAQWASNGTTRHLLKTAKLVIGRTKKHPATMDNDGIAYKVLPCPSILCDFPTKEPREGPLRIAMSIQLSKGTPGGVINHVTSQDAYVVGLRALKDAIKTTEVDLICHHKSEFLHWSLYFKTEPKVNVIFSSWYQDLWHHYRQADVVVSTRLHAVLWARAMGKPGLVLNNSDRHIHALEQFPGTECTLKQNDVTNFIGQGRKNVAEFLAKASQHQQQAWEDYIEAIEPHVKAFKLSQ